MNFGEFFCYHGVFCFVAFRDVTWEDLAFFNADLFEGLSRMVLDSHHPMMTSERFQATYCCHFEVNVQVIFFASFFCYFFVIFCLWNVEACEKMPIVDYSLYCITCVLDD